MKSAGRIAVWVTLTALVCICFLRSNAEAQDKKESQLRSVHGQVIDKADDPVQGSVVFMKNMRTNMIRSQIADEQGNYRFSGLDPNVDYELHAEKEGAKSNSRTVSNFDSRKDIVLNLKMEHKKN